MNLKQSSNDRKLISLKKYTPTRWGTIHEMFKSILDSKDALLAVAVFLDDGHVRSILLQDDLFWQDVNVAEGLFGMIVKYLAQFEKDEFTLAMAYSHLHDLREMIKEINNPHKDLVLEIFENRWSFLVNESVILGEFN